MLRISFKGNEDYENLTTHVILVCASTLSIGTWPLGLNSHAYHAATYLCASYLYQEVVTSRRVASMLRAGTLHQGFHFHI